MNMAIQRILFPTDYSAASDAALRHAISLARQSDALLSVVYVAPTSTPPRGTVGPPDDTAEADEAALLTLLSTVSPQHKSVRHEFRTLHGDPATEIVRLAGAEHFDLIVMATSGRSGLRRALMGSVAETVVRQAPCPVITLREPTGKASHQAAPASSQGAPAGGAASVVEFVERVDDGSLNAVELVRRAVGRRATDVHIDPLAEGMEVRFRIDGRLEHFCRLSREIGQPLVTQLKVMAQIDIADPFHAQEGRISLREPVEDFEVRVTRAPVVGGESMALRLLNRRHVLRPLDQWDPLESTCRHASLSIL